MTEAITHPQVVVACAWYNRADYIRDTVDSLLAQDFDSFEIVLVNDGSPDPRVREILDSYDDPRLRVIHQENTGFVGAIRRAIEASDAPFIAIQGAGDMSYPSRLREQHDYLINKIELIGVSCQRENTFVGGRFDGEKSITGQGRTVIKRKDFLGGTNPFSHGEVMFRRATYEKVGGYRKFFKYAQDHDLWLRMSEYGNYALLPKVLYFRRVFAEDGIAASGIKGLVQRKFSFFAKQCARDRDQYGVDLVSIFGMQAGLFRTGDRLLAKNLSSIAAKHLYFGNRRSAFFVAHLSLTESITMQGLIILLAAWSAIHSKYIRNLIVAIIELRGFKEKRNYAPILPENSQKN